MSKEEDIHQEPNLEKEEMNLTISCKALARITTPQTLKIEGNIKKKKVQEVKDRIEKEEMNPTISCNSLVGITTSMIQIGFSKQELCEISHSDLIID